MLLSQNDSKAEEGLEVKLPTHGQMQQQVWEKSDQRASVQKITLRETESRNTVFPMFWGLRRVEKKAR